LQTIRATARKLREVPAVIRVGCENIIGSENFQVQISGMTGVHASKINGTYVSAARAMAQPVPAPQSPAVAATAAAAAAGEDAQIKCVHISGATGNNAFFVNGVYDEVDETSCGQRVYIKRSNPTTCIHFCDQTGQWIVTETENRGTSFRGKALLSHSGSLHTAASLNNWEVMVNNTWAVQPDVRCASGAGAFEGGLKKIDDDVWLEYHAGKFAVCDAQDRRQGKGYIFCDVDADMIACECFDFRLLCTPWLAHRSWYSIKLNPKHTMRPYSSWSSSQCNGCGM
jgi:hypothetical protein